MSKRVLCVFAAVAVLTGCAMKAPSIVTTKAPSYGYKAIGGDLIPTRPEGQVIQLQYNGGRYTASEKDIQDIQNYIRGEQHLRSVLDHEPSETKNIQQWAEYHMAMNEAREVLSSMEGKPVPMTMVSKDPSKPCKIMLPPPRNTADADFFRALGEATFACMKGGWR